MPRTRSSRSSRASPTRRSAPASDEIRAELAELQVDFGPTQDEHEQHDPERRRDMEKARRKKENERLQAALDDALPEVFACAREAMRRTLGMRHFDVQLIGGAVLHQGKIAEMKTGEGKTLVAPLAAILNGLTGRGVHVVTVNDYLARRDPQWMGPIYHFLGLSRRDHRPRHGVRLRARLPDDRRAPDQPAPGRPGARPTPPTSPTARTTSSASTTSATTWSRSWTSGSSASASSGSSTRSTTSSSTRPGRPLIISGQAEESADLYYTFARLVPKLQPRPEGAEEGGDYFVDLKDKAVSPTEDGVDKMERLIGVDNLYDADPRLARHFEQALPRPRPLPARQGLPRQGRRDRHRRRVHRAPDARPPLERGAAPGDRGEGGPAGPARVGDPRHDHLPELLPPLRQAGRHDRHGDDRGRGVPQDLQARCRRHPDERADDPRRRRRPRLPQRERQVQRRDRRDRGDDRGGPTGPRRHRIGGEVGDPRRAAPQARVEARGPQRQVPREGGGDRRPGRAHRRP